MSLPVIKMALDEDIMYNVLQHLDRKELTKCASLNKTCHNDVTKMKQEYLDNLPENYWTSLIQMSKIILDTYVHENRKRRAEICIRIKPHDDCVSLVRRRRKYSLEIATGWALKEEDLQCLSNAPERDSFQAVLNYVKEHEHVLTRILYHAPFLYFQIKRNTYFEIYMNGAWQNENATRILLNNLYQIRDDAFNELNKRYIFDMFPLYRRDVGYKSQVKDIVEETGESPPPPTAEIEVHNQWVQELREAQHAVLSEISYEE